MRHESYDRDGNLISVDEIASPLDRFVSVESFFLRFTPQEVQAINSSTDIRVVVLRNRLYVRAELIDLDAEEISQAMLLFQSLGILTADKAAEVRA